VSAHSVAYSAGVAYQAAMSVEQRRDSGTVYTPLHIVDLVLDMVGYHPSNPIEGARILDPACGCGVFIEQIVRRLAARLERLGLRMATREGAQTLVDAVAQNVFGVEIDPDACDVARGVLRDCVSDLIGASAGIPSYAENVLGRDFLLDGQGDLFDASPPLGSFDFIVGNPPYVTTSRLDDDVKERLRRGFRTARGRLDLYILFFERALGLLARDGRLGFVTPDKYLTSESTAALRELIAHRAAVMSIARFSSHRVFEGAATVPCVTVLRAGARQGDVELAECDDVPGADGAVAATVRFSAQLPRDRKAPWHLLGPAVVKLSARLRGAHRPLSEFTQRISAGIATGRDGILVVPSDVARDLEPELLHPIVRGQDIQPFRLTAPDGYLIVPYLSQGPGAPPELVDLSSFPRIHAYLSEHRAELESRHCVRRWRKSWYDLHDPWTFNLTASPKVLFADVAANNRFAFDPGEVCPLHSAYYAIPEGILPGYLTALLCSKPIELLVRLHAPVVKDGFSRYRAQFVKTLPVPDLDMSEQRAIGEIADPDEREERVAHAFGLSAQDRADIREQLARLNQRGARRRGKR